MALKRAGEFFFLKKICCVTSAARFKYKFHKHTAIKHAKIKNLLSFTNTQRKIKNLQTNPTRAPRAQGMSHGQEFYYPPLRVYELGNCTKRVTNQSLRAASLMSRDRTKTSCTKSHLYQAPVKRTPSTSKTYTKYQQNVHQVVEKHCAS